MNIINNEETELNELKNNVLKMNNDKNKIIYDIDTLKHLINEQSKLLITNNSLESVLKNVLKNQDEINNELKTDIKNINHNIQETSVEISCKFHKYLSNYIKEQKEINNKLNDEILEFKTINESQVKIMKKQEKQIKDIYNSIYAICIAIIFLYNF